MFRDRPRETDRETAKSGLLFLDRLSCRETARPSNAALKQNLLQKETRSSVSSWEIKALFLSERGRSMTLLATPELTCSAQQSMRKRAAL